LVVASDGSTAYSLAEASGRKLVSLLVAEAAVLHSIESQNLETLLQYLTAGAYVNIRNPAGWTPLMFAVSKNDQAAAKAILELGADANRTENDGWTALHFAASGNFPELVSLLLSFNASPAIQAVDGRTARAVASELGFPEIVDLIPDAAANTEPAEL
jgi:ankyrin repeat protein